MLDEKINCMFELGMRLLLRAAHARSLDSFSKSALACICENNLEAHDSPASPELGPDAYERVSRGTLGNILISEYFELIFNIQNKI